MRIDRLEIENFKCFAKQSFDLNPHFTLFVGGNGSGKTSVLEALAVAAGIWLLDPPDSTLSNSRRNILEEEVRLIPKVKGDRSQFVELHPVTVRAYGQFDHMGARFWTRYYPEPNPPPWGAMALTDPTDSVRLAISSLYQTDREEKQPPLTFPVIAYYSAGRAWDRLNGDKKPNGPARRWAAFRNCLDGRIDFPQLNGWFEREALAAANRGGRWRPGGEIVRLAILQCLPGADDVYFDGDRDEIVVSIDGKPLPIGALSAGQRVLAALVADLAIKAVTQNAFLIPPDELDFEAHPLPLVLSQTPGIVLIDELDIHLHPGWQRRIAADLKRTFPAIQFVCTSHSPQIIGELTPDEIRVLHNGTATTPDRSFGMDSDRVLEELMGAPARNEAVESLLHRIFVLIDREDLPAAKRALDELKLILSPDDAEVSRAEALMSFLEADA